MKNVLIVLAFLVGSWLFLTVFPVILREIGHVIANNVKQEAPTP